MEELESGNGSRSNRSVGWWCMDTVRKVVEEGKLRVGLVALPWHHSSISNQVHASVLWKAPEAASGRIGS